MACCVQYLLEVFQQEEDQGQSRKEMTKELLPPPQKKAIGREYSIEARSQRHLSDKGRNERLQHKKEYKKYCGKKQISKDPACLILQFYIQYIKCQKNY